MKQKNSLQTHPRSLTIEQETKTDNDILIPSEVALMLRISMKTLSRLTKRGEIPYRKVGQRYRYFRSDLKDWSKGDSE
jgi:excisionase family DNA binding protein